VAGIAKVTVGSDLAGAHKLLAGNRMRNFSPSRFPSRRGPELATPIHGGASLARHNGQRLGGLGINRASFERKGIRPGLKSALKGAGGFVIAVSLWELVRTIGIIDSRDLPSVGQIFLAAARGLVGGELMTALLHTISAWVLGLLIAFVLGTVAGIGLALLPWLEITTRPFIEFLRPIPSVALIPVALLTLGVGLSMQLAMIVFASIWPVLFSAKAGVEDVDPRFIETGKIFGLGRIESIFRIVLPAALPSIVTGTRTAAAIAFVLSITVEMLVGQPGIGLFLQNARFDGQATLMWSAILISGVFGYGVNALFLTLERLFLPWSPEHRER
jgi:NitT/TauT family transport system permease protein